MTNAKLRVNFNSKYRRVMFTSDKLDRMTELILATGIQRDVALIECGAEDDPVTVPPQRAIAHLVGKLTGKSAYFLSKE